MTVWSLEPRDPLLLRDGRPFSSTPGARARSLAFPFPSTIAGALRTRVMQGSGHPLDVPLSKVDRDALLIHGVRGPLLGMTSAQASGGVEIFVPAPSDCVLFSPQTGAKGVAHRRRLLPLPTTGEVTPLPETGMHPVMFAQVEKAKPLATPPRFWQWQAFAEWLLHPGDTDDLALADIGIPGPQSEQRTHLAVQEATQTAEEGKLFQTRSLEFRDHASSVQELSAARDLSIILESGAVVDEGIGVVGGERRIVRWRKLANQTLPSIPDGLADRIAASGACRLILLTPALFDAGWRPGVFLAQIAKQHNVAISLKGAVVLRPQVVSGWDHATGMAKPSRRLAPAGSVYFLTLGSTPAARKDFVNALWMTNISDEEQSRRDGFGLCALGSWEPGAAI